MQAFTLSKLHGSRFPKISSSFKKTDFLPIMGENTFPFLPEAAHEKCQNPSKDCRGTVNIL
jgi:hypothetical protein